MRVGVRRDLGQVRDAQDLVAPRETPQAPPDRVGAAPADAAVHLVEDQRRRRVGLGQDPLDGEGDPGQLAAGRDLRERPRRLAGVRGEAIDDLVDAGRIEGDRIAIDLDGRLAGACGTTTDRDFEDAGREAQLLEDLPDRRAEAGRRGPARRR